MAIVSLPDRARRVARIDLSDRHALPSPARLAAAAVLAVGASLAADALLVSVGTWLFPSTSGYTHFRFPDYATLTVIGVLIACAAWPVVVRVSSAPRWLFLRLAVVVTLVLWLPDLYLLARHQPVRAVAVLMAMHLAIAVVTYNLLVRMAPAGRATVSDAGRRPSAAGPGEPVVPVGPPGIPGSHLGLPTARSAWVLVLLVAVEFVLGIAALVVVPTGRPSGWLPDDGTVLYLVHAGLGLVLTLAAMMFLLRVHGSTRIYGLSAWIGAVGVAVAGIGGVLAAVHPLRLVGLACMFVGPVAAGFGYLLPAFERLSEGETPPGGPMPGK